MVPLRASLVAGGRARARRLVTLTVTALVAAGLPLGAANDPAPEVSVAETDGLYHVAATFIVREPGAVAYAVLTDYERIPRYMPDVRTSTVLERGPGRAVIAQEAVARVLLFSRRIHLVLEVTEGDDTIAFRDRSGESFARYSGAWRISDADEGATVVYELTAKPAFSVPAFLLKRLLAKDAAKMIDRLRAEIGRRAAAGGKPSIAASLGPAGAR